MLSYIIKDSFSLTTAKMKICVAVIFLSLLAGQASPLYPHEQVRFLGRGVPAKLPSSSSAREAAPPYTVGHVTQTVDHFNSSDTRTFSQRYLVYDKYWDDKKGPLFVYTGNEGDIVWFFQNSVSVQLPVPWQYNSGSFDI